MAADKAWKSYQDSITAGEERRLADAIDQQWKTYSGLRDQAIALSKKGDREAALR